MYQTIIKNFLILTCVVLFPSKTVFAKLALYCPFDEIKGSITWDAVNNMRCVLKEPKWVMDEQTGGALDFNGKTDYIDLPDFSLTSDYITITALIKIRPNVPYAGIVYSRRPDQSQGCGLWIGPGSKLLYSYNNDDQLTWAWQSGLEIPMDTWAMVAVAINPAKATAYLYTKTKGLSSNANNIPHIVQTMEDFKIGWDTLGPYERFFNGLIDEVTIFDHCLNEDEVKQLCKYGVSSFTPNASMQKFTLDVSKAEHMVETQSEEAIVFLENLIKHLENLKKQNPDQFFYTWEKLYVHSYLLLANVKAKTGSPPNEIANVYERVVLPPLYSQLTTSVFLSLLKNLPNEYYAKFVEKFLLENDTNILNIGSIAANFQSAGGTWQAFKSFLDIIYEKKITPTEYQNSIEKNLGNTEWKEKYKDYCLNLSTLTDFYSESCKNMAQDFSAQGRHTEVIKMYINILNKTILKPKNDINTNIGSLAANFHSAGGNWQTFKRLLDIIHEKEIASAEYQNSIEKNLDNTEWKEKYKDYCLNLPTLTDFYSESCKNMAQKYFTQRKYSKAVEMYINILDKTNLEPKIEISLLNYLFEQREHQYIIPKLDSFIKKYKTTQRTLVKEAILLKGRGHIQLGEINKAIDEFFVLTIEYPETQKAPEANFFMGYCHMLQGSFDEAKHSLNLVCKNYPQSKYAREAKLCLTRIESMTE